MISYFSNEFIIYLSRWIFSGFIMIIPLYFLVQFQCCKSKYQKYIHLILVQIVGAFIFWYIDQLIFKG